LVGTADQSDGGAATAGMESPIDSAHVDSAKAAFVTKIRLINVFIEKPPFVTPPLLRHWLRSEFKDLATL
jgi:hypothetical protein